LAVIYVAPPLFMPRVYLITTTPTDALLPMVRPLFRRLQREPGERLDCWRFRSQKLPVCSYAHARQSWQNRHHPHRRERRRDLMQASIGSQSRRHHTVSWHRSWSKQRQAGHPREQAQSLHRAQLQFRADAVARRRSHRMNASSQPSRWATTSTPRNLSVPGVPAGRTQRSAGSGLHFRQSMGIYWRSHPQTFPSPFKGGSSSMRPVASTIDLAVIVTSRAKTSNSPSDRDSIFVTIPLRICAP